MKFGESLNQGVVPEWQHQYLDYKRGKKLIKKVLAAKESPGSNDRTPLLQPQDRSKKPGDDGSRHGAINLNPSIFNPSLKGSKHKSYEEEKIEFNNWVEQELVKVEMFYKEREQDVYERFLILEDQLYQLKDHKQISLRKHNLTSRHSHPQGESTIEVYKRVGELAYHTRSALFTLKGYDLPSLPSTKFLSKWRRKKVDDDIAMKNTDMGEFDVNYFENRIRNGESLDLSSIDSESIHSSHSVGDQMQISTSRNSLNDEQIRKKKRRDYETKKHFGVPYLLARKQLKDACLEFYRSLMILRSYKELNRTAFRKITKKFDKANNLSISKAFMEKIDKSSYFLTSDIIDKLVFQIEELYISFFDPESMDRKRSLEKFKSIAYALNHNEIRLTSYYTEFFTSGLFLGLAVPLLAMSLYLALHQLYSHTFPEALYILQIYGGFFLVNLLFVLFGFNMAIFEHFKINYKFIFEFDIGTALDYKQFWLLPSVSLFLLSILMWFSFNNFFPENFPGRDWPWIFLGICLIIMFWPFNYFYRSSRRWLLFALWRILWSGFYPVEFRDFFIGDLLCSLTYTLGNISFFFCLYATHWSGTNVGGNIQCGSSKSRSMGFFAALPSIWRFLQCVRRYADTGDWFPHLANMLKYGIGAIYYCLLSVYRIDKSNSHRIAFIVMASINSIYCSLWDIIMDWSLLQSNSKYPLLRDNLFYKNPIYYYVAMVVDVILRFQWIFYAFFTNQIQQSAATSFLIALAELIRRIIWVLFRMENEHCTNVILFRASRDSPLPYAVSSKVERAIKKLVLLKYQNIDSINDLESVEVVTTSLRRPATESIDSESQIGTPSIKSQLTRRKSTLAYISDALNKAHIKDFQRKKNVDIEEDSDDEDKDNDEEY
ncbi:protein Syg1p [[Candida] jaroonii]|uniref:Protein Syg1p n=1 Tax=[Candida] jaroonii TaxID=467808 RepID=A0ACA9YCE2_9ASCO|nr:protein Syg1p [[Candida] jaroonii]